MGAVNGVSPTGATAFAGISSSNRQFMERLDRLSEPMFSAVAAQGEARRHSSDGGGLFGALSGIARGVWNGAVNTVKSLATPKGLLMLAGGIALTVATGGAAVPFLVGAGVAMGGVQVVRSAASGNWEGVGEGLFTIGASVAGARLGPKQITSATGEVFTLPSTVSTQGSLFSQVAGTVRNYGNLLLGRGEIGQLVGSQGTRTTLFQLARGNAAHFWQTNPGLMGLRTTLRNAWNGAEPGTGGFKPGQFDTARSMLREFRGLEARAAAGETLTPLERQWLNFYGRELHGQGGLLSRAITPGQLVYAAARSHPSATALTASVVSGTGVAQPTDRDFIFHA